MVNNRQRERYAWELILAGESVLGLMTPEETDAVLQRARDGEFDEDIEAELKGVKRG